MVILIVFIHYIVIIRIIASRTVPWLEVTTVASILNRYKTVSKLKKTEVSQIFLNDVLEAIT